MCRDGVKRLEMCADGVLRVAKENKLVIAAGSALAAGSNALQAQTNVMADITMMGTNATTAFGIGWGVAVISVTAGIVLGLIKFAKRK